MGEQVNITEAKQPEFDQTIREFDVFSLTKAMANFFADNFRGVVSVNLKPMLLAQTTKISIDGLAFIFKTLFSKVFNGKDAIVAEVDTEPYTAFIKVEWSNTAAEITDTDADEIKRYAKISGMAAEFYKGDVFSFMTLSMDTKVVPYFMVRAVSLGSFVYSIFVRHFFFKDIYKDELPQENQ
jgi:hypothetical protein